MIVQICGFNGATRHTYNCISVSASEMFVMQTQAKTHRGQSSGGRAGNLRAELLDRQAPLFGGQIYFGKMEEWESKLHRPP